MASSIALVRAEVDREIARMARLGQIMDERSALTRTLAEEARARLASEKLAEESEQTPAAPPEQHEDILEEGNATEMLWLSEPVPVRQQVSTPQRMMSVLTMSRCCSQNSSVAATAGSSAVGGVSHHQLMLRRGGCTAVAAVEAADAAASASATLILRSGL